jgi:hypothetical protein
MRSYTREKNKKRQIMGIHFNYRKSIEYKVRTIESKIQELKNSKDFNSFCKLDIQQ